MIYTSHKIKWLLMRGREKRVIVFEDGTEAEVIKRKVNEYHIEINGVGFVAETPEKIVYLDDEQEESFLVETIVQKAIPAARLVEQVTNEG